MKIAEMVLPEIASIERQRQIARDVALSPGLAHHACRRRRLSGFGRTLAFIALAGVLSAAAFGENPVIEMAKTATTTGGTDPHGDSMLSIQNSLRQFAHLEFMLRLLLSFGLAVACAWVVGWHPRRSTLGDPLSDLEERKALIILGMVGAIVAELSGSSQTLAFVIFGIGALLRFRTVLDNPKLTGKAITVVVIGLACGMGSWAMAVFVTAFSWLLIFWLESHVGCRMKIRLDPDVDPQSVYGAVQSLLISRHCRLQRSELIEAKRQMVFLMLIPSGLDPRQLEADVRSKLPQSEDARIAIDAA
jgi:hypothetical protein